MKRHSFFSPRHPGADRVLRSVYVWCAMAAACQKTSRMTCDRHEDTAEPVWVRS